MKKLIIALGLAVACSPAFSQSKPAAKKTTTAARKPAAKATAASGATTASAKPVLKSRLDSVSYSIGMNVAGNFKAQQIEINQEACIQGFRDYLAGNNVLNEQQMQQVLMAFGQELEGRQRAQRARQFEANKKAGEDFLAKNKTRDSVTTLPNGLQYQVLKAGNGTRPQPTDKVKVHYHGTLIDGTVFDSSVERGEPVSFPVNQVIRGWQEILPLMPKGSKWKVFIPAELAYADSPAGSIPPYSALIFEIELLDIEQ